MTLHTGKSYARRRHPLALFNLTLLTLWLLSLSSLSRAASEAVGHILFVHGEVHISGQLGLPRTTLKGDPVYQGDLIRTGPASSVQLRMADQGYFAVRPQSEIRLDHYQYHRSPEDRASTSVLRGGLRSITGAIGQHNKKAFQIRTPVATIGIRGTDLTAFYIPQHSSPYQTPPGAYLTVQQGSGVLYNSAGEQLLIPGQAAFTASANIAPAVLSALPPLFLRPTFESFFPDLNNIDLQAEDKRQQAVKAAALKQEQTVQQHQQQQQQQQPPQPQLQKPVQSQNKQQPQLAEQDLQDPEQAAPSGNIQNPEPDRLQWRGHLSGARGSSEHLLHTADLMGDSEQTTHSALHNALRLSVQETPYQGDTDQLKLSAGLGAHYQPANFISLYADLSFKRTELDQSQHYTDYSSGSDTGYYDGSTDYRGVPERRIELSGEQLRLGINLQLASAARLQLMAQSSAQTSNQHQLYNPYRIYQQGYCYRCNQKDAADGQSQTGKTAATPGYEHQHLSAWLTFDPSPVAGFFIGAENQFSLWQSYAAYPHNYGTEQPQYRLIQFEEGLFTDSAEAGIRLNPLFMPLDLYVSGLSGRFGSEGEQAVQVFDGEFDGLRARLDLNRDGIFSSSIDISQLEMTGSGYSVLTSQNQQTGNTGTGSFVINEQIRTITAGAALKINSHIRLQALAQQIRSTDKQTGQERRNSLNSELRLTLVF